MTSARRPGTASRQRATAGVRRVAAAASKLERYRDTISAVEDGLRELSACTVIVVDGELAVLAVLGQRLIVARRLLQLLEDGDGDGDGDGDEVDRLERLVAEDGWAILDEITELEKRKRELRDLARTQVGRRLHPWSETLAEVKRLDEELRDKRATLPKDLARGRDTLASLVTQASTGLLNDNLASAWRALEALDETPASRGGDAEVAPSEVRQKLTEVLDEVKQTGGRIQLTVLRGPLTRDRYEYTLMLLTPGGEHHVGVNVQEPSTIVVQDRRYFLQVLDAVGNGAYRTIRAGLDRAGRPPLPPSTTRPPGLDDLKAMGSVLYKLLIPDRMKDELRQHSGAQLVITTNDLELPWELMFDGEPGQPGGEFLCLRGSVSRMPVGRSRRRQVAFSNQRIAKRRVALVASAGTPRLDGALREVQQIEVKLRAEWKENVEIRVLATDQVDASPNGARFRSVLTSGEFDIVHYAGHAAFDPARPDQSGLVLDEQEVCFAQKIQRLLRGNPLVFLNACESARLHDDSAASLPEGTYEGDPRDGLASAFVYGGALSCIGTMWPVTDMVAADFATAFYSQVLHDYPVGSAMLAARRATAAAYPDDPSWAAFVLYGDPAFRLRPRSP